MKVCVIQPPYSMDVSRSDEFVQWELDALDRCDASMDLIALPEYSNLPTYTATREEMLQKYEAYTEKLMNKASETAKRCNSLVFLSCLHDTPNGLRNGTIIYGRDGSRAGVYHKQHLVNSEIFNYKLDHDYTWEYGEPPIIEVEGVKYGFLICYDAYFYENFANIARYDPDVIVACSHQRSDSHDALRTMHKFCAYNTNAWVVRASVSMGEDSPVAGTSMVISPDGTVLLDMENQVGLGTAEIDPHQHYLKPAGFGNPPDRHHHYVEIGRRPWKYRQGGSAMVRFDDIMPYPRLCAHRGFNTVAPENSMPAFGAAIALGAQEIEFDLWETKDGHIVSIHDEELDRVSDGHGFVWDHTLAQLQTLNFGGDGKYAGMGVTLFEDILKKFTGHAIMNIHVKDLPDGTPLSEAYLTKIIRLIRQYECTRWCYFMTGSPADLATIQKLAPDIPRCAGAGGDRHYDLVQKALDFGCKKIQLFKPHFKHFAEDYVEDICRRAHEKGLRVNIFWADQPALAREYLEKGVDTVLTNDYLNVLGGVKDLLP